ncbi:hypothetical protein EDD57_10311 [Baia soyae]|uniref:Uncharacterized protein n=1 Tax=Baia soyae TaxID=1544746 RepID=A0A4R2RZ59_9BACL|nr:hypothetical protein EDD57_10311 [Baia soyae]
MMTEWFGFIWLLACVSIFALSVVALVLLIRVLSVALPILKKLNERIK